MRFRSFAFAPLAALALVSCAKDEELYVDKSWVVLAAVPGNPAAAYFTIHGGPQANALISVSVEPAIKSEIHESVSKDGMMTMAPLDSVPVPAKSTVVFAPGGKHVMLFELRSTVKPGGTLQLQMNFSGGDKLLVDAPVFAAGQAPEANGKN